MRPLFIIYFVFLPAFGFSQSNDPFVYGEIGMGTGKYTMYQAGINWIVVKRHCVGLSYYRNWRDAAELPPDYEGWLLSSRKPNDKLIFMAATYGRVLRLNNITSFILKAGPVYGTYRHLEDFTSQPGYLAPNYSYTIYRDKTYGLLFNPSFELTFTNTWGLSLGGHALVTNNQFSYAVQAAIIGGSLRRPLKEKNFE